MGFPTEPAGNKIFSVLRRLLLIALSVFVAGCATGGTGKVEGDPLYGYNTRMHAVNNGLDRYVLKPASKVYQKIVPRPLDRAVTNFFANLGEPVNSINMLLQGRPDKAAVSMLRFLINSVIGLGGIFDLAAKMQLPRQAEDFGQTLAVWGVPAGPYIVLPLLGPSTLRDSGTLLVDREFDLQVRTIPQGSWQNYVMNGASILNVRAALLALEGGSFDLSDYEFVRDSYLQTRRFSINNGAVADDGFLDDLDFEDEDYEWEEDSEAGTKDADPEIGAPDDAAFE